jgi:hypothetical protein
VLHNLCPSKNLSLVAAPCRHGRFPLDVASSPILTEVRADHLRAPHRAFATSPKRRCAESGGAHAELPIGSPKRPDAMNRVLARPAPRKVQCRQDVPRPGPKAELRGGTLFAGRTQRTRPMPFECEHTNNRPIRNYAGVMACRERRTSLPTFTTQLRTSVAGGSMLGRGPSSSGLCSTSELATPAVPCETSDVSIPSTGIDSPSRSLPSRCGAWWGQAVLQGTVRSFRRRERLLRNHRAGGRWVIAFPAPPTSLPLCTISRLRPLLKRVMARRVPQIAQQAGPRVHSSFVSLSPERRRWKYVRVGVAVRRVPRDSKSALDPPCSPPKMRLVRGLRGDLPLTFMGF